MNYFLCKLKFITPLHIGDSESARSLDTSCMTICADTLFSALCHTALTAEGQAGIDRLVEYAGSNQLRFSDLQPFCGNRLFLPKPYIAPSEYRENKNAKDRKKMKKLTHLPLDMLDDFLASLRGESDFEVEKAICSFGEHHLTTKASIRGNEQTMPYSVGLFSFYKDCGLYLIIAYETDEALDYALRLLRLLSLGGIGGKISSGYGKFEFAEQIKLNAASSSELARLNELLCAEDAKSYLLLTSSLPTNDELETTMEDSNYGIIRRGGFIQSFDKDGIYKKQTQYFFCCGSVFKRKYNGDIFNVAGHYGHPVYRYAKPIFLGIG